MRAALLIVGFLSIAILAAFGPEHALDCLRWPLIIGSMLMIVVVLIGKEEGVF